MSYVIIEARELGAVRERLQSKSLTSDDERLLGLLLQRAQLVATAQIGNGRTTVDSLPVGLDLVK